MSYSHHHSHLPTHPSLKRPYPSLDPPMWPSHPSKRPRPLLTPASVISAITQDDSHSTISTVSPPYQPPHPSTAHLIYTFDQEPALVPTLPLDPDAAAAAAASPLPPVATSAIHQSVPCAGADEDPPRYESAAGGKLRSDEDIQADVANSFSAGQCGTGAWSNELLIQVLANEVEDLMCANEHETGRGEDGEDAGEFVTFYSSFKQPFALEFYMRRLVQYVHASHAAFVTMFVYLDRVQKACRALVASEMNCHRLVFTCLVLAVKYLEDEVHSNVYYAKVGGLTAEEMNALEVKLLEVLDWNLSVSPEVYAGYEEGLIQTAGLLLGGDAYKGSTE
eukprot:GFKZ01015367.1.p1 GENE.GFKZ01015367.1~~GFKZ01015367.1.p1  ORF type:complete len:335 (+),score=65.08 GFKZ01015367.1:958-1962(+)